MENSKIILNKQNSHWETTFAENEDMFGLLPSEAAVKAAERFKSNGITKILELGGGQGRDTIYFAQQGFQVCVLDYSSNGLAAVSEKAKQLGLSDSITAIRHDIRNSFPFENEVFEGCYSHMLFCMALNIRELELLSSEIRRVLKRNGINSFTARNTKDSHFGTGIHRGENMYEVNGFIVHFFSREMIDSLAKGYKILDISEFEEGELPRKLYHVTLEKQD